MIIQNKDNKITIVSMADKLLPIHETLGYELMAKPDFDVQGQKLHLVDGILAIDTELTNELATKQLIKEMEKSVQGLIDSTAKGLGYDNMNSTAKYLRPNSPFYDECIALGDWTDAVWAKVYEVQADVDSGAESPTIEELLELMPVYGA